MSLKFTLHRIYSLLYSFQNVGERVLYTFTSLYADIQGATPAQQGILLSLQNILAFIGQQFFGKTSDRLGRPLVMGFGYLVCLTSSFLMFNFIDPVMIIITFAFYNIGFSAVQPAWNALIGDTYSSAERAKMLGSIGSFATLVGGVMYLSAGLYSEVLDNPYRFLFTIAGISFTTSLVIIILLSSARRVPERIVPEKDSTLSLFDPLKNRRFRRYVLIDSIFAMALSTTWPLFPKATNDLATPSQVAIIWFTTFVAFSITARQASRLKQKINSYRKSFFLSRMMMWIVPTGFAFATSWTHILLVRIVSGLSFGFYSILQKEYILETAVVLDRPSDRGWFLGSQAFVWGILTFIGSLVSGYIAEYFIVISAGTLGYRDLFLATAVFRALAVFGFLKLQDPGMD